MSPGHCSWRWNASCYKQEEFRRVVDIVTLDATTFTYRVHPDAADRSTYYDIVHTPTTHPEPATQAGAATRYSSSVPGWRSVSRR
ncbi:DUF4822 domain-containing protein [Nocardia kruczakiae]|uniref:DUF4822 domain-containing protein n=1 Tax=Nocardia kruczakiae TaxID=261477 RepID=UPI00350E47B7